MDLGKSTFAKLIAGILKPKSGEILIDGQNTKKKENFLGIRKKIGIVFQNPENQIIFPKVYDDMVFALKNLEINEKEERIQKALEKVNMQNFKDQDTYELSLGQKQRIAIASLLAIGPKYLVLDEPTTMIDSEGKEEMNQMIKGLKKEGITAIYVTNLMQEIFLSDKIIILEDGKIKKAFPKEEILENIEVLKECKIKIPEIIQTICKLKEHGIKIQAKEWTMEELTDQIIQIIEKYKG